MSFEHFSGDVLAWSLAAARTQTLALVADVPDELWTKQSEAREHPPGWVVGHLLLSDSYLLYLLAVESLPSDFGELLSAFGPEGLSASLVVPHERAGLVMRLARAGELRTDAVRALGAVGLARAMPDAALASTQPTLGHHLNALVLHEGYHAGQLSTWRKLQGLAPTRWCLAPSNTQ